MQKTLAIDKILYLSAATAPAQVISDIAQATKELVIDLLMKDASGRFESAP